MRLRQKSSAAHLTDHDGTKLNYVRVVRLWQYRKFGTEPPKIDARNVRQGVWPRTKRALKSFALVQQGCDDGMHARDTSESYGTPIYNQTSIFSIEE
jgi:hypothetical protein